MWYYISDDFNIDIESSKFKDWVLEPYEESYLGIHVLWNDEDDLKLKKLMYSIDKRIHRKIKTSTCLDFG